MLIGVEAVENPLFQVFRGVKNSQKRFKEGGVSTPKTPGQHVCLELAASQMTNL